MTTKLKDLLTITLFLITTLGLFLYVVANLHNSKEVTYKAIIELNNLN